jgi:hypothetical protein
MNYLRPELLDIINFAICEAVNEYLGERSDEFFRRVGEYHLHEAMRRGLLRIDPHEKPLDVLATVARYLESNGYMERILIDKLGDNDAEVEMCGVSVTDSSVKILNEKKTPSHYMTNLMFAALSRLGVGARLKDVEYDQEKRRFREYWKILGRAT